MIKDRENRESKDSQIKSNSAFIKSSITVVSGINSKSDIKSRGRTHLRHLAPAQHCCALLHIGPHSRMNTFKASQGLPGSIPNLLLLLRQALTYSCIGLSQFWKLLNSLSHVKTGIINLLFLLANSQSNRVKSVLIKVNFVILICELWTRTINKLHLLRHHSVEIN